MHSKGHSPSRARARRASRSSPRQGGEAGHFPTRKELEEEVTPCLFLGIVGGINGKKKGVQKACLGRPAK